MGFGYLLLAVKSEQDNYLIGNPQFTFFKAVYRKHTNFSIDYQFNNFIGDTSNAFGRKLYIDIPKNGDLLHRMYLTIDITNGTIANLAPYAYNFIEYMDIFIGGQRIDRHYGEWLAIWHEFFEDSTKSLGLANMVGMRNNNSDNGGKTLTIPLRFWFNSDIGLALPLIALQYNDIKLEIKFNNKGEVNRYTNTAGTTTLDITNIQLISEYIHLDKEERRMFSSNNHEYLITQVQSSLSNVINNFIGKIGEKKSEFEKQRHKIDLRFNYPVKELFWTIQDLVGNANSNNTAPEYENSGALRYNYWNNYEIGNDQMSFCNLVVNGRELTEELPASFYRDIQQYQYHNGYGINYVNVNSGGQLPTMDPAKGNGVYSYSFALKPDDYQPSGSLNFSKLENSQLRFGLIKNNKDTVYTINLTGAIGGVSGTVYNSGTTVTQGTSTGILRKDHNDTDTTLEIICDNGVVFSLSGGAITITGAPATVTPNNASTANLTKRTIAEHITMNKAITIYALNYNVLRVMSGMAGLAFIN